MTSTTSSISELSYSTASYDDHPCPFFFHLLILSGDKSRVLMEYENDEWDLPCFKYENPNSVHQGLRTSRLLCDLRDYFSVSPNRAYFNAVVELTGGKEYKSAEPGEDLTGVHMLLVMECQPDGSPEKLPLPNSGRSGWKDITFFSAWVGRNRGREEVNLDVALQYVQPESVLHSSISDPRLQMGWFKRASQLLVDAAKGDGAEVKSHVMQRRHNFACTLMLVHTSQGLYFAKAPALGSNEVPITAKIAELFPESSPRLLTSNNELNFFITKGFHEVRPDNLVKLVRKLGELQLRSLSHLEELSKAGCKVRDLDRIVEKIQLWERKCPFDEHWCATKRAFEILLEAFMDACRELQGYKIPCTLVHGDFGDANATCSGEEDNPIWVFDWQLACISHPFSDFYRLVFHDNIPEELLKEAVDEYLGIWEEFEDLERAREAYDIAWKLGFFLKMWALEENRQSCDFRPRSNWESLLRANVGVSFDAIGLEFSWE